MILLRENRFVNRPDVAFVDKSRLDLNCSNHTLPPAAPVVGPAAVVRHGEYSDSLLNH